MDAADNYINVDNAMSVDDVNNAISVDAEDEDEERELRNRTVWSPSKDIWRDLS
jgi:hypothetical protein